MGTVRIEDKTPWEAGLWLIGEQEKIDVNWYFDVFISSYSNYEIGEACFIADKAIINMIDNGV